MRSIAELTGAHPGAVVHVFGSGAELDTLNPTDFLGDVTVTMNRVPLVWPIRPCYALTKYHADALELQAGEYPLVVGIGDRGYLEDTDLAKFRYGFGGHYFDHCSMMAHGTFNVAEHWPVGSRALVVGPTVQMTAMHFAAHLGASRIVMHGCTGRGHVAGYYPPEVSDSQGPWLDDIRQVVAVTKAEIERRYPVKVEGI